MGQCEISHPVRSRDALSPNLEQDPDEDFETGKKPRMGVLAADDSYNDPESPTHTGAAFSQSHNVYFGAGSEDKDSYEALDAPISRACARYHIFVFN